VESGAGGVVFSDASMFTVINPPSIEACIQFGTGPSITAKGVGTVCICVRSKDTQKVYSVSMRGAHYVPQQHLNLLSTRAIMSQGGRLCLMVALPYSMCVESLLMVMYIKLSCGNVSYLSYSVQ
jgi:hypothetical protein